MPREHNTLTNRRGRVLEEFLMSKHIHILNKERDYTNFQSHRGTSNNDITVISNQLLNTCGLGDQQTSKLL
jgi:hypothetical protein